MNGVQNRKARDLQKPVPGCMGRMINIFDLSSGMAQTMLLTEKAHRDGFPIPRNQPDVVKSMDATEIQKEEKPRDSGLRSSCKKLGGVQVKMIVPREMSGETESKRMPPNVIARLMGLDALPIQLSALNARRTSHERYSRNSLAGLLRGNQQLDECCPEDPTPREIQPCAREKECRDVCEVWKKPPETSLVKDQPSQKGRYNASLTEERMALVRQKFIEAKRLATDERFIRSKEFQDALKILGSNRDMFLKYLEGPNSLSSMHIHEFHSIAPRRITVLKPARTTESKSEKYFCPSSEESGWDGSKHHWSPNLTHQKVESVSQPTKIVVLKPSPGMPHEIKNMAATGSREVAKVITQQMQRCVSSNRRDEALLSSVLSNGYLGDDSSLNRPDNDYIQEYGCSSSDSEIVTSNSRHSWDCIDRLDSLRLISSSSRTSCSPESSVVREAKKRLSERWALVASNGIGQELRQERSSSTLGQMLSISEVKKDEGSVEPTFLSCTSNVGEEDFVSIVGTKDGCSGDHSPKNLSRSKSISVCSFNKKPGLNQGVPDSHISKRGVRKEAGKSKSGKLSLREKVSSLFFYRSKKPGTENTIPSPLVSSDVQSGIMAATGKRSDDFSRSGPNRVPEESTQANYKEESGKSSSPSVNNGLKQSTSLTKSGETEDQPSPISVLEAPFEDDTNNNASHSCGRSIAGHPQALSRSRPIESLARSLSRADTRSKTPLPKPFKHSGGRYEADEERERFVFIQRLLSSASLDIDSSSAVFAQWHSPDSPLDPKLMDEFLAGKEEVSGCRARLGNQKLLFDLVNAALVDISRATLMGAHPWAGACGGARKVGPTGAPVAEVVWGRVRDCYSGEGGWGSGEAKNGGPAVDGMVKREMAGRGWAETMWSEIDELGMEIGGWVLDELVEETLIDFTDGCL